jgi:hypothetical protein|tara:strand:- start:360 stop:1205 length:846 start_codon:yes stop_codon:yes gene_type:complete
MKNLSFTKGQANWDNNDILEELENFIKLYEKRPIKNNKGGMLFTQMFYFYFILRKINPELVIESGIYKGQSTWLIENTLPNSEIIALDIDLNQREYISKKAFYSSKDFRFHNFSKIPNNTLVFFDDHVNHVERIIESNFFNIKNIILEDNYSPGSGDFQTLKQIYNNSTFNHNPGILSLIKTSIFFNTITLKKIFNKNYNAKVDIDKISKRIRDGNDEKNWFENISNLIDCYYEFPPLTKYENLIEDQVSGKPLLENIPENLKIYLNQIKEYNFFTYIKLI